MRTHWYEATSTIIPQRLIHDTRDCQRLAHPHTSLDASAVSLRDATSEMYEK